MYAVCGLMLLFRPVSLAAQTFADTLTKIDACFKDMDQHTPGGVLTVSRAGKIVYNKAFGMADLEHGIPADTSTLFEAGSVSKQFTATALLLLVREGRVSLDDDVRKYIPELPVYEWPVTVRHLLNHTSGLKDWGVIAGLGGWPRGSRVYTNQHALAYIVKQSSLNHRPGDEYLYSNSNYTLLTFIVERATGETLPDFTRRRIFEPLGMASARWRTNFKEIVKGRSVAYEKRGNNYYTDMPFENTYGHAALLLTAADLDKWNASWKNSPIGGNALLLLRTEQGKLNSGEKIIYAGGVRIADHNGIYEVNHSGATAGYRAWLAWYPEKQLSIAFLCNDGSFGVSAMANAVAGVFLGERPRPADVKPEPKPAYTPVPKDLAGLQGTYYSEECDGELSVGLRGNTVKLFRKPADSVVLKPLGRDRFGVGAETEYVFKRNQKGIADELWISAPRARNVRFVKVKPGKGG